MADNPADNSNNANQPPRRRGRPPGKKAAKPSEERSAPTPAREERAIPTAPPVVIVSPPPPPMAGPASTPYPPKRTETSPPKRREGLPPKQTGGPRPQQPGGSRPTGPRRPQNPLDRGPRRNQASQTPAAEKPAPGEISSSNPSAEEPTRGEDSSQPAAPSKNNARPNQRYPSKQSGGFRANSGRQGRPYSAGNRQEQPRNQGGNAPGNGQKENHNSPTGESNTGSQNSPQNRNPQRRQGGQNRSNAQTNRNNPANRSGQNDQASRNDPNNRGSQGGQNRAQNQGPRPAQNGGRGQPDPRGPQGQRGPQDQQARNNRPNNNPSGQGKSVNNPNAQRKPPRTRRGALAGGQNGAGPDAPSGENIQSGTAARAPRKPRNANPFVYHKPPPIKTSSGIKALSQNANYALSWWAARWIAAMENLVDGRRLSRGKSYAKDGQVLSIEEKPGGVQAMVQGSRPRPYRVAIEVIPLSDREWEKVFDVLASQALFAAQLLAGEMPRNIEEAFESAGTSLFPARLGDLHTDCSCPDWANPCKHVAATHYILAERFDEDPFLLFRLRGRTSEQILTALRERRSSSNGEEPLLEEPPVEEIQPAAPLNANLAGFYSLAQPLDDFALSFKPPAIEMAVLKRLGDPNFLGQESLLATLEPVYLAVRSSALEAALGEAKEEETSE